MNKHTPGPWEVRTDPKNAYWFAGSTISNGHFRICDVQMIGPTQGEVGAANASLIAAAPELLEALKGLHDDVMDYIKLNGLGGEDNHWLVIARAVIAKATAIAEPSS